MLKEKHKMVIPDMIQALILSYCLDSCPEAKELPAHIKQYAYTWVTGIPASRITGEDVDNFIELSPEVLEAIPHDPMFVVKYLTLNNLLYWEKRIGKTIEEMEPEDTRVYYYLRPSRDRGHPKEEVMEHLISRTITTENDRVRVGCMPTIVDSLIDCCRDICNKEQCKLLKVLKRLKLMGHIDRYIDRNIFGDPDDIFKAAGMGITDIVRFIS